MPLHLQPVFEPWAEGPLPGAEELCARHVCLPVSAVMTPSSEPAGPRVAASDAAHDGRAGRRRSPAVRASSAPASSTPSSAPATRCACIDPRPPHRDDVEWRDVDVLDLDALTKALDGSGPVFHLAAMADVNDVIADPARATEVNVVGTVNVLEAAPPGRRRPGHPGQHGVGLRRHPRRAGRRDHVASTPTPTATSTSPRRSPPRCLPRLPEPVPAAVHRPALRHPVRPAHAPDHGAGVVLPPGPGRRAAAHRRRRPPGAQLRLRRGPRPARTCTALRPEAENLIVNLDGPEPVSIRRLAELTQELVPGALGRVRPVRPGDLAPRGRVSERAGELLGWTPDVDIDEGVRRTFDVVRRSAPGGR